MTALVEGNYKNFAILNKIRVFQVNLATIHAPDKISIIWSVKHFIPLMVLSVAKRLVICLFVPV